MPALTLSGDPITDYKRLLALDGDGAAVGGGLGVWEGTTNLCTNGGFETNTTGWSGSSGATISRVTTEKKFGSASARVVTPGAAVEEGIYEDGSAAVAALSTVTVSIWVKAPAGALLRLRHVTPGVGVNTTVDFVGTGDWQKVQATAALQGAGTTASVQVQTRTSAQAITFYVDGAQDELQPLATPYVHTDGATATRAAARVQAPASLLNATQGWIAFRVRPGWGTATEPGNAYFFDWRDSALARISGFYEASTNTIYIQRGDGATLAGTNTPWAPVSGTAATVIFRWTATACHISVDAGVFVGGSLALVPTLAATLVDIGSAVALEHFDSDILWFACGTGTLTDADAASIHSIFANRTVAMPWDLSGDCKMVRSWLDGNEEPDVFAGAGPGSLLPGGMI